MSKKTALGKASIDSSSDGKEFSCKSCHKEFASKTTLHRHRRNFHPDELDHNCPTCGDVFASERAMKSHHKQAHGESIAGVELTCAYCASKFTSHPSKDRDYCSPDCWSKAQSESVELICEFCNEGFEVKPSEEHLRECCSMDCKAKLQSQRYSNGGHPKYDPTNYTVQECKNCGSEFEMLKSNVGGEKNSGTYCSNKCSYEWRSENIRGEDHPLWIDSSVECDNCGVEFQKKPSKQSANELHFCSRSCHGEWISDNMTGENHPRWKGGHVECGADWYGARRKALDRDKHTCQDCQTHRSDSDVRIHVHHITPVRDFDDPNDAHYLLNLITLCQSCHSKWEGLYLRPDTRGVE